MQKNTLKNKSIKQTQTETHPLKIRLSRLLSTMVLPGRSLFPRIPNCFWLLCLLLSGAFSPLYAQSGEFDGTVNEEEGGTLQNTYNLTVVTDGLKSETVSIIVEGESAGDVTGSSPYTVKPGKSVTVSFSTNPDRVKLLSLSGWANDGGNWFLTPLVKPDLSMEFTFTMPATDITLSFVFKEEEKPTPTPDPDPEPTPDPSPVVYYTVTLPEVEGAVTDPVAGAYAVEAWSSFFFTLTLKEGYEDSQPVVTTNRGETLKPDAQGRYKLEYVRGDLTVLIDSVRPNLPPVANERIDRPDALRLSTSQGVLRIGCDRTGLLYIYTISGQLIRTTRLEGGEQTLTLPEGMYLLRFEDKTYKLIL